MHPTSERTFDVLLLDIEGTTTSISFVYDTLFPHARAAVSGFLREHRDDPGVRADVELLRAQAARDAAEGAPQIVAEAGTEEACAQAAANVLWQMDRDRKTTGLKSLQGRIWEAAYQGGALKGHLYDDVPPLLSALTEVGVAVYIYSSGSVAAQQLLFAHSAFGDLTPLLGGYFDTTTGPKKVAASYEAIAEAIGVAPGRVLFLTDNLDEAHAAAQGGLQVKVSVRPGNPPLPAHRFETLTTFSALAEGQR